MTSLRPTAPRSRRSWRPSPSVCFAAFAVLLLVTIAISAEARPGGGSSYSGGSSRSSGGSRSSGSSSSGGGDSGAIAELLIWLCIRHPAIGIPLVLVVIAVLIFKKKRQGSEQDWNSAGASDTWQPPYVPPIEEYRPPPASYDVVRAVDPSFSRIVFEDFVYSLYAEIHLARGRNALDRLSAYLAPEVAQLLRQGTRGVVDSVIVGALRLVSASATSETGARLVVEIESNYSEAGRGCYVVEQWTLVRGPNVPSRTPDRVRILGCPGCGAPQDHLFGGTCRHCQRVVNDGSFDWTLQSVSLQTREERPPILTSSAEERGTGDPTVRDPDLPRAIAALRTKDPTFDVARFQARVGLVFEQFQLAWSGRNLAQMRPFLSDALFTTQQYWITAYLAQRLRNVLEGARITNLELVKVASDPYYDAITVRLFATSIDYVVGDDGRHVSGSRSKPRAYSEYWTFLRGTNRKGEARADLACANCGAPLSVNMVGQCTYCKVKVTTGDFDWVLSRIEQDESYTG